MIEAIEFEKGNWNYRVKSKNGNVLSTSYTTYGSRSEVIRGVEAFQKATGANAKVVIRHFKVTKNAAKAKS